MAKKKRTTASKKIKPKSGRIRFASGQPLAIEESDQQIKVSRRDQQKVKRIGAFIKAYLKAGHELLEGPYKDARELAPVHLAEPSRVYIICCTDGVIIRYERCKAGEDETRAGFTPEPAAEVVKGTSENVILCVPEGTKAEEIDTSSSPKIELFTANPDTGEKNVFVSTRIAYVCPLPETQGKPKAPPGKPFRLIGVVESIRCGNAGGATRPKKSGRAR